MIPYPFDESQGEFKDVVFESNDISECLDYYKESGDISHLERAVFNHYTTKREINTIVKEIIEHYQLTDNIYLTNKLTIIKNKLR